MIKKFNSKFNLSRSNSRSYSSPTRTLTRIQIGEREGGGITR